MREGNFDRVRSLAQAAADRLKKARPEELTTTQREGKRADRVFLDTARNAYGQTAVAPYAVDARPGAPVATPIDWDELPGGSSSRYTIESLFRRLSQKRDPWEDIGSHAQGITGAEGRMEELQRRG